MEAVILASGRGARMLNHTDKIPKPMLRVNGKTLIEHKLEILPNEIKEVVLVVGYLGDQIRNYFGALHSGKKITYVNQEKPDGTARALWLAKEHVRDKFLVMMGDDIYSKEDVINCLKHDGSILVKKMDFLKSGGKVVFDKDGNIKDIIEGNNHNEANAYLNLGLYVLKKEIFKYEPVRIPGKKEFGLPQTLLKTLPEFPLKVVLSKMWIQITSPEDLKKAERLLSKSRTRIPEGPLGQSQYQ